jgi:hypothetical protein
MKKTWVIIIVIVLVFLAIGIYYISTHPTIQEDSGSPIGGQRDSHGCLGPAGYSWNETEKECVREWSHEEDRYQITNFQNCKDAGYPITKTLPSQCETASGRIFYNVSEELQCENDFDCDCGKNIETGECFIGNKNYVNTEEQCPDFCTGIAGNFRIACINNECRQVSNLPNA